jgi:zinc resistance-associated protein|uniref:Uncharacterized protein n=1 Tax=Thermodesulfobacterium geofontis TaxID=1295609 RepID=A0A7V4JP56_9BACT
MLKKLSKTLAILGAMGFLVSGTVLAQNETTPQTGQMRFKPPRSQMMPQVDPQKAQAFCKEINPQWQKMWQIRNELRELWSKTPPDWTAIEKKETEFIKTKLEIDKKAYEMGLPYGPRGLRLRQICGW